MEKQTITINQLKKTRLHVVIEGDSDLILNKKSLSFEREEIFKQSHPKGTPIPDELNARLHYNLWEKLCTSITWEKPAPIYDRYEDYTEELWRELVTTNRPCILSKAFSASFYETFVSFYKEATGRPGTDFKRSVSLMNWKNPVTITSATYSQHLTPNTGINKVNVLAQHNIFSGWSCELELIIFEAVFPLETVIEIINSAGEFIGIGTKRAEGYGRYHITTVTAEGI